MNTISISQFSQIEIGSLKNSCRVLICLLLFFFFSGCAAIKVKPTPKMTTPFFQKTTPLKAVLFIPESVRSYKYVGNPSSFSYRGRSFEFELGDVFEKVLCSTFSQIFEEVTIARELPEKESQYHLILEPNIESFDFKCGGSSAAASIVFGLLGALASTTTAETSINLTLKVYDAKKTPICVLNSTGSGLKSAGGLAFSPERDFAESASQAIAEAVSHLANMILMDRRYKTYAAKISRAAQDSRISLKTIPVKILGYSTGKKGDLQTDCQEAILNAKLKAIERAGVTWFR